MNEAKRYLVTRKLGDQIATDETPEGVVLTAEPGDELMLEDDLAAAVERVHPGLLREMHPKTETDWEPDS